MKRAHALPAALALALAACLPGVEAPWLTMPSPEEHAARYFPATPGTSHAECSCNDCHGGKASFREFQCVECHTQTPEKDAALLATHSTVAGFEATSDACFECHAYGLGVDHTVIFPITVPPHGGLSCAQCHLDRSRRDLLACAGCHGQAATASQHSAVVGYAFDSRLCLRCHADSQVDRTADHGPFLIAAGAKHGGTRADCLRCHPALRADKPFGADFIIADCFRCHDRAEMDGKHQGRQGYASTTEACLTCHPTGRKE
jgi:hypothetical protein